MNAISKIKNNKDLILQVLLQFITRVLVLYLLVRGVFEVFTQNIPTLNSFLLFVSSGGINGLNYGFHNHSFLHEDKESQNYLHRSHIIWEHVLSGMVSSLAAYLSAIQLNKSLTSDGLIISGRDIALILFALLGYCGFLPMIMWFLAHSIKTLEAIMKRNN